MPTYQEKQFELFEALEKKRSNMPTIVEPVLDYANDDRMCLTCIVYLSSQLQEKIASTIIEPLAAADRKQYFYVPGSLHITIQNVKAIHKPPLYTEQDIIKVREVFKKVIPRHQAFSFELCGLLELPTSISIRGYCDERLLTLVQELRRALVDVGVPDDKKYASDDVFFGASTVCRFTNKPDDSFFQQVSVLKQIEIGKQEVQEVLLITTNAVCHPQKTTVIDRYTLQ